MIVLLWIMLIGGLLAIALGWYMRRVANRDLRDFPQWAIATNANERKRTGTFFILGGIAVVIIEFVINGMYESA